MHPKYSKTNQPEPPDHQDELYGWDFHKWPLISAVAITAVFYILIKIFI